MATTPTRVDAPLLDAQGNEVTWAVSQEQFRKLMRTGEYAPPPPPPPPEVDPAFSGAPSDPYSATPRRS